MKANSNISKESQKPSLFDLAIEVSKRVEVQAVNLIESLAKRSLGGDLAREVKIRFAVRTSLSDDKKIVSVFPRFQVTAGPENGKLPDLVIEAEFAILYSISSTEGLDEPNFKAFGELNGVFNCWPYWREYVQQTTTRMGLPPLVIPVYRPDRPTLPTVESKQKAVEKKSKKAKKT